MLDTTVVSISVLEERLSGLRDWLDERFKRLDDQLSVIHSERGELENQVGQLRERVTEHEKRLIQLERIVWLIIGAAAFLSPVVIWAVIEIIKVLLSM